MPSLMRTCLLFVLPLSISLLAPAQAKQNPLGTQTGPPSRPTGFADGIPLRILPFGGPVLSGRRASDVNEYRSGLHDKLSETNAVSFVGFPRPRAPEKHKGLPYREFDINALLQTQSELDERPNVVLLTLTDSTFAASKNQTERAELIEVLLYLVYERCPDAAILVATVPPLHEAIAGKRRAKLNAAILQTVAKYAGLGLQAQVVDLGAADAALIDDVSEARTLVRGYEIVAERYYSAIVSAGKKRWLKHPVKVHEDLPEEPLPEEPPAEPQEPAEPAEAEGRIAEPGVAEEEEKSEQESMPVAETAKGGALTKMPDRKAGGYVNMTEYERAVALQEHTWIALSYFTILVWSEFALIFAMSAGSVYRLAWKAAASMRAFYGEEGAAKLD